MPLASGALLGPYEIISLLGAGGMGEVYRARDTRLDRAVALKILPSRIGGGTEARERFEREARAVSSLNLLLRHFATCTHGFIEILHRLLASVAKSKFGDP